MKNFYKMKLFRLLFIQGPFRPANLLILLIFLLQTSASSGQVRTVTGIVKDAKGETLPGVSVKVKGTQTGQVTDLNGKFQIQVPGPSATLIFSYIGFGTQEIAAGQNTTLSVIMNDNATSLNEVVVVGYGIQKRSTLTGAVSTVSGREILQSPTANTTNSLVGRLPGLTAVQRGGQPGADAALINIRGVATYNSSTAIVVVDGIERPDFGSIDPNEIESISILKDAASTAVYGIRGANGVIVVTTKAGREGKPKISYSGNVSAQAYTGIPRTLNAYDNASLINEANRNDGLPETWSADELQKFKDGSDPLGYPDINWYKYLTRKYTPQTQHNINISGGTKVIRYFVSAGYLYQDGIFKKFYSPYGINSTPNYSKYNFRSNLDINLSKDLDVGVKLGGSLGKRYTPAGLKSGFPFDNVEGMISRIIQIPAFAFPVTLPDGRIAENPSVGTNIYNPLAYITRYGTRNDDNNTIESTFNLNYKLDAITPGLSFKATFAYDSYFTSNTERNATWAAYVYDRKTGAITLSSSNQKDSPLSTLVAVSGGNINTNLQTGFNYQHSFGKHNVSGLLLFTRQLIKLEGSTALTAPPKASQGLVNRLTYNYSEKYFFEFDAAYNGSENFAPGYRYGFFPAVSAGWTLSNEAFLKDVDWLSYLKLRGSYGLVGNDQLGTSDRFLYLTNYATQSGGMQFGIPTSPVNYTTVYLPDNAIGNPLITWEKGTKRNIGIESRFFKDALKFNLDLFNESRRDILTARQSGLQTYGHAYPRLNIGEVYNKGYEAEIDYQGRSGEFNYGMNAQVAYSTNIIKNRDEPGGTPEYQKLQGKQVGQFFGFLTDGFYASQADIDASPKNELATSIPGDLKYRDYNGDGVVNNDDIAPIGYSRVPEYTYSFTPRLSWKGFSLSVLFQGVANVSSSLILSEQNNGQQMYEFQLGRWTPETAETATWPALHSRGATYINYNLNDFILQDASYLKIRNAELSWNLPSRWLKALKVSGLRIYASGQNLHTWTKYKMYLDPENTNLSVSNFNQQSVYPSSRVYNLGVNIQL